MRAEQYLRRRNGYAYPAVCLEGGYSSFKGGLFQSVMALDEYHRTLLRSRADETAVFGYLSVLYWGHYSGQDGTARAQRALGKVRLAKNGAERIRDGRWEHLRGVDDLGLTGAAHYIRVAASDVDGGRFGDAVATLAELPGLQFAFASKVVAFLRPETCGVIDSVIARKFTKLKFALAGKYVRNNRQNISRYNAYCDFLTCTAAALNARGKQLKWVDRDGARYEWRAIDVERAMY